MTDAAAQTPHRDNLLGICHALGEDLGFDPIWLRLALGGMLLVSLELPFIVYGVLGLIVLASRLLVGGRRSGAEVVRLAPAASAGRRANDDADFAEAA